MERRFLSNGALLGVSIESREKGKQVLTGYAALFHRSDDPGTEFAMSADTIERVMPGAFDEAMKAPDVVATFNHNMDHVIGRTGAGTLRLALDERGLKYEVDLPETTIARDLAESVRRGDVAGSSFSFKANRTTWGNDNGKRVRELRSVTLYDIAAVTRQAYPSATTSLRSEDLAAIEQEKAAWEAEQKAQRKAERRSKRLPAFLAGVVARAVSVECEMECDGDQDCMAECEADGEAPDEERAEGGFTHNSETVEGEPAWADVDKEALPDAAFSDEAARGYPHHFVQDGGMPDDKGRVTTGTMYLHRAGLDAALAEAADAEASEEVLAHMEAHRKDLEAKAAAESEKAKAAEEGEKPADVEEAAARAARSRRPLPARLAALRASAVEIESRCCGMSESAYKRPSQIGTMLAMAADYVETVEDQAKATAMVRVLEQLVALVDKQEKAAPTAPVVESAPAMAGV
ncbi:MAG: hypothetical protein A3F84_27700 [Candidatus Handelsmanbacteria bacterium RIFCSPLOWO2_12_FULL_64_10]|uniref:Prohead serine protease domain-containing protein n=1 Tax=Handelsmanbacteria sp. (strain RIFCSPLOWO2_12_FULL_64_10) TaxID=1817868 RepID=A0A1F6C4H1_HANXR|nr:MAG: hypothetical protein A3F84_27700 [Candidatus Handelsmanbacteria bacterium RIFCSPLOWO2_12_FULL_64_10]